MRTLSDALPVPNLPYPYPANRMKASFLLPLLFLALTSFSTAQTIGDADTDVEASQLTLNLESKPTSYIGEYKFGFSEGESELTLTVRGSSVSGELLYGV